MRPHTNACSRTPAIGVVVAGIVLASCVPVPASGPPGIARQWERVVAPFTVLDEAGDPYQFPFLGGFNLPRPQLADVDADGDDDLFVQEYADEVFFFRRDVDGWSYVTSAFEDLEIGEWFRFVDMDADGDVDLLTEQPFSHVRYYRNVGEPGNPQFIVAADTLVDDRGAPIFSDRQNIPNVIDLDCDGLLDLFIGRVSGTIVHYEEARRDSDGVPRFALVTERFEDIEIVAQLGSLHGANTLAFHDVDLDGDPDLFWGDFFEPGLLLIENTGTCAEPFLRNRPVPFPTADPVSTSGYNAPTFGRVDLDGRQDLLIGVIGGAFNPARTSIENLHWLDADGQGRTRTFVERSRRFLSMLDIGSESTVASADLDGDGDVDLLLGSKLDPIELTTGRLFWMENTGTEADPSMVLRAPLPIVGSYHYAPALGDLDGDGDVDLILGTWGPDLRYYRNNGAPRAPRFDLADSAIVTLTRGSHATPALGDLDGDGDLDLLVGEASGTINFYRNDGTSAMPRFTLVSDQYEMIDVGRRSAPALADLDNDGDLDMVVGRERDGFATWRNVGTVREPRFVPDTLIEEDAPPLATPAFADLDGDGDIDLIAGTAGGGVVYYRRVRGRRDR